MFADDSRQFRRVLFYALIGSILFGAVLGLVVVLRDQWTWLEIRVMVTAATVALASVAGLACDLARSSRRANVMPIAGLVLTLAATVMVLVGVWGDIDADDYWKAIGCVAVFAAAAVQVCLLSIARLSRKYAWVFFLAGHVAFGLAAVVSLVIVSETHAKGPMQLVAALSIIDAALVLIVPVLHRLSRMEEPGEELVSPLGERSLAAIETELDRLRSRIHQLEKLRAEITGERRVAVMT